jgi:hypothetical protein
MPIIYQEEMPSDKLELYGPASEESLQQLSDIGQEMEKARKVYEHDNDTWWNALSETEREDAFYAVCKRLQQGELKKRGSYRYVLYDVFGFGPGMYLAGMDCGFMALHNAIYNSEELQPQGAGPETTCTKAA